MRYFYGGVVVRTRVAHEVEGRAPVVCFVERVGEDYTGGADGGRPGEGDAETPDDEHLVETLKVAIVRFLADGTEGVARLLEGGGGALEFVNDAECCGERFGGRPVLFLILDLAYYI